MAAIVEVEAVAHQLTAMTQVAAAPATSVPAAAALAAASAAVALVMAPAAGPMEG